eukprot:CAMPEP_0184363310 /NCGR_PEP_ID=MMETSP1089-20130417/139104_1 /TAXON_ID=38269 ORGANISM="Gloeochaete wittrockiana, Strain SAG46.84" /NCGR_SAMPLE_ID=MMETSP1089 /ASSEMBLY_ACC=CAM_ASM_000445 /LENGTH=94 /DNA_ID=CAMNT_0026703741 /DNA_START=18 /DNA_END=298 /DNA_ORIENTATION=+
MPDPKRHRVEGYNRGPTPPVSPSRHGLSNRDRERRPAPYGRVHQEEGEYDPEEWPRDIRGDQRLYRDREEADQYRGQGRRRYEDGHRRSTERVA